MSARIWWRPTTLRSSVDKLISWIFDHMTTDQRQHSLLKLWVATLFSVATSWHLNAAPYLCGVHKPCPLRREETVPAVRVGDRSCTSLVPRQMIAVFALGTRLHVRMRTTLENGVLRNGQQPQSVVNGFYRPGWIWGYEDAEWLGTARCDKHPFRAKIKVSAWTVFELSLFEQKS